MQLYENTKVLIEFHGFGFEYIWKQAYECVNHDEIALLYMKTSLCIYIAWGKSHR